MADDKRVDGGSKTPIAEYLPLAAAIIALGGIYWAHHLSKRREEISRFHAAAAKLRDAFATDIVAIENGNLGHLGLMDYLRGAYDTRHAAAITLFEGFIQPNRLSAFSDDWNRYRYGENEDGSPAAWDRHTKMSGSEKALFRVRKLLTYASDA